jgi:hypothetical protein
LPVSTIAPFGGHHQDPAGVHQHGGLGVPVGLGADVDAVDHQVDLPAGLGELHQAAQHAGDPVHVLGAGVHRDPGARGDGEPLQRHAEPLGQVDGGDDAGALRLGERAELPGGVAEEHHAGDALGVDGGEVADHPDHHAGAVAAVGPVHGLKPPVAVQVVLGEVAGWEIGAGLPAAGGEHADQLVGVDQPAPAEPHHALPVGGQRPDGPVGGGVQAQHRPPAGRVGDVQHPVARPAAVPVGMLQQLQQERLGAGAAADHHGALGQRPAEPGQRLAAVLAPGDQPRQRRVEPGGHGVALDQAGVGAPARPGGDPEQVQGAGGGREAIVGVLGVEADRHGLADRGRRPRPETLPAGDEELQLDQVQAGGRLGDLVPGTQPRLDPQERERAPPRVVEELDGAGVAPPAARHRPAAAARSSRSWVLLGVERGTGRLRQHHPLAPPEAGVAHPERPDAAVVVGEHLDLEAAGALERRAAPGAAGTPAASASRPAPGSSASRRSTSGSGPMTTTPSHRHSSASSRWPASGPQPAQAASARPSISARSRRRSSMEVAGPMATASSASRTTPESRSASASSTTVSSPSPRSRSSSRTAWTSRMAASPRSTIAIRLNCRSTPAPPSVADPVASRQRDRPVSFQTDPGPGKVRCSA